MNDTVEYSFHAARLDIAAIHRYLSNEAYWCLGIPRATVEKAIAHSLCMAAYRGDALIGFARLVTDRATFAYLGDVFVLAPERGQGIATTMVRTLLDHPDAQGLRRTLLFTRDMHALYARLGFDAIAHPERGMEIVRPDIYQPPTPSAQD